MLQAFPKPAKILLVGCGKMGASLLMGWLNQDLIEKATVLDPAGLSEELQDTEAVQHESDMSQIDSHDLDLVILAIKPQIMADVCTGLAPHIQANTPILSIAAGQTLTALAQHFDANQPIVRSMPNTPASIGKGMSAAIQNHAVSHETKALVEALLSASGDFLWLDNEPLMDAVTALSGSGPAYIFHLIETLSTAGEKIGLSPEHARIIARQTVIGAASLAEHESHTSAAKLRKNVTSPGGTTQAALDILMDGRLQELYDEALEAAKARSIELSQ